MTVTIHGLLYHFTCDKKYIRALNGNKRRTDIGVICFLLVLVTAPWQNAKQNAELPLKTVSNCKKVAKTI